MTTKRIPQARTLADVLPLVTARMPAQPRREMCPACYSWTWVQDAEARTYTCSKATCGCQVTY